MGDLGDVLLRLNLQVLGATWYGSIGSWGGPAECGDSPRIRQHLPSGRGHGSDPLPARLGCSADVCLTV